MNRLLGLDLETANRKTTGGNRVLEIGMVLWDVQNKTPIVLENYLIKPYNAVEIDPESMKFHKLTDEILLEFGFDITVACEALKRLWTKADAIVTHNGTNFDYPILDEMLMASNVNMGEVPNVSLIDTMTDLPYPSTMTTSKLIYLAAEYGFLNPFNHRAVFDILSMLHIVSKFDINDILKHMNEDTVSVQALVSYADRALAKDARFKWNGDLKIWSKDLKLSQFEAEKDSWEFKWEILKDK
jgi:DNA polymerase III epsilon subunit-like protein